MSAPNALVTILTAISLAAPSVGETQQAGKVHRIGQVSLGSSPPIPRFHLAFVDTLREHGFVDGQNLAIERRLAAGQIERLPELVADLIRLNVDVFVLGETPAIRAAKQATTTIPIVMIGPRDPVGDGLVTSLAHPGGNVTGVSGTASFEATGKLLQLIKEAVPTATRVAVLTNVASYGVSPQRTQVLEAAARKLGLTLRYFDAENRDDFDRLFAAMVRERVGALLVPGDPFLQSNRKRIVALVERHRLPAIYGQSSFVYDAGGLMFYGHDLVALVKQAAVYVSKILKGARPADLPVQQPTRFELVINLKAAKALGLTIPPPLLFRADEVIQ
jgi:putative ABC transport system substrate-binding protein